MTQTTHRKAFIQSREQAFKDGTLIDVTHAAIQRGYKIPVAVSALLWDKYVEWTPEDTNKQVYEDMNERLQDVLWLPYLIIRKHLFIDACCFQLFLVPRDGKTKEPILTQLKITHRLAGKRQRVLTIMLPHED